MQLELMAHMHTRQISQTWIRCLYATVYAWMLQQGYLQYIYQNWVSENRT